MFITRFVGKDGQKDEVYCYLREEDAMRQLYQFGKDKAVHFTEITVTEDTTGRLVDSIRLEE